MLMANTWYRVFIPPKHSCVIEIQKGNQIIEISEYPFNSLWTLPLSLQDSKWLIGKYDVYKIDSSIIAIFTGTTYNATDLFLQISDENGNNMLGVFYCIF